MTTVSKEQLIALLRRTARDNGNRPLGGQAFYSETRLSKRHLWDAGIRSYGDLCELAGYPRNRLNRQMEPDQLFEPLAVLTAELERFPDHTDREMAHRRSASFPSREAYSTAQKQAGPLEHQFLEWCRSQPQHAKAQRIIEEHLSRQKSASQRSRQGGKIVAGYVYLMRYGRTGRDYKIGMSEDLSRRHSQISAMIPGQLTIVHVIETDDPHGIERYWLQRFEGTRVKTKKEIFRLEAADVAAFKSRKYQ